MRPRVAMRRSGLIPNHESRRWRRGGHEKTELDLLHQRRTSERRLPGVQRTPRTGRSAVWDEKAGAGAGPFAFNKATSHTLSAPSRPHVAMAAPHAENAHA